MTGSFIQMIEECKEEPGQKGDQLTGFGVFSKSKSGGYRKKKV
jgi:hypothetical protein